MIKAYVVGISTNYENEDIEIRYRIYKDQGLVGTKTVFREYEKPSVVSHVALLTLLKELQPYMKDEITIIINDSALYGQIRGTSQTKNKDVHRMAEKVRKELNKFKGSVMVKDVTGKPAELSEWDEQLRP